MSIEIKNALGIERMGSKKKDIMSDPLDNLIVESHGELGNISRKLNVVVYPIGGEQPFSKRRALALVIKNINAAREILLETMSKYDLRFKE